MNGNAVYLAAAGLWADSGVARGMRSLALVAAIVPVATWGAILKAGFRR